MESLGWAEVCGLGIGVLMFAGVFVGKTLYDLGYSWGYGVALACFVLIACSCGLVGK